MVEVDKNEIHNRILRSGAALVLSFAIAACATTTYQPPSPVVEVPKPAPKSRSQYGVASWYGPGFNGHRTSTGDIYDQNDFTAASMVYPLGSRVMVTNVDNGRSVEVTINDHGPLKKGRKIDLSHKAAAIIGMLDKGTAHVRIDLLSKPRHSREVGSQPNWYVQVGSFESSEYAHQLGDQLNQAYHDVRIDEVAAQRRHYYRVRMGAFDTRSAAQARAAETAKLGYPIIIVSD
ncbi:MAG: septal ring lytic transglycosylase RlpA family protein [Candidatus Binataceae bacterium]